MSDTTVAVVDGEVAGFVMVGDEVEQVYVAARHRGAGVADVLMTEAERGIARAGHAWLMLIAALPFFSVQRVSASAAQHQ